MSDTTITTARSYVTGINPKVCAVPVETDGWTGKHLPDLNYYIRAKCADRGHFCNVEALTSFNVSDIRGNNARVEFQRADSRSSPDPTPDIADAERFVTGSIKWDGCSDLNIGRDGYMHKCGPEDVENIGKLLRAMYDLAATMMPNADWVERFAVTVDSSGIGVGGGSRALTAAKGAE